MGALGAAIIYTRLFEHHGEITKVVLPPAKPGHEKRYGFVHFKERSMAMKALKNTQKYEIDGDTSAIFFTFLVAISCVFSSLCHNISLSGMGDVLDCSLAKPPADNKKVDMVFSEVLTVV
ncbi:hypothetical protein C4D60_Mb02t04870 [Musa balbisiana]|uniref:RRM domain-containing protein n=1 Tax=Musa balbisiana TaxID=52838 RepID=A0A4S8I8A0_MUSBA|nr:hypothetical protein C4D60_Mb02t04870 [Musa balbisiana]